MFTEAVRGRVSFGPPKEHWRGEPTSDLWS